MSVPMTNRHAPVRSKRVRNKESPWIASELRKLITNRDKLKKQAVISNDMAIWDKFKKKRNKINNEIKKAKSNCYQSLIESNFGKRKEIWKSINEITHRKSTNNSSINERKIDDRSATDPSDFCQILSDHFQSIGLHLASVLPNVDINFESYSSSF